MIRRITLENYMSHARTEIEPAAGLTVLIGPNNCGKSAVVSALMTLCGENAGDFMVRHGEKVCRITVETQESPGPDGSPVSHTVTWQRKRSAVSYTINGREIARAGKGNLPDDLHQVLRLPPVRSAVKDESYPVHFGAQKDPIFLIDSESKTAAFFSSSAEAERLLEMQRLHKQKVQTARAELRNTEAELSRVQERLQSLNPLDQAEPELQRVEVEHQRLAKVDADLAALQRRIERIELEQARVRRWSALATVYADCCHPPAFDDPQPLNRLIDRTVRVQQVVQRQAATVQAITALQSPPPLDDEARLLNTCRKIDQMHRLQRVEHTRAAALAALVEPPTHHDVRPLQQAGLRLKQAKDRLDQATLSMEAMQALQPPPVIEDPLPLSQTVASLEKSRQRVDRQTDAFSAATAQLAGAQERIVAFVMDHPLCPTCGAVVTPEHLMAHGGGDEH